MMNDKNLYYAAVVLIYYCSVDLCVTYVPPAQCYAGLLNILEIHPHEHLTLCLGPVHEGGQRLRHLLSEIHICQLSRVADLFLWMVPESPFFGGGGGLSRIRPFFLDGEPEPPQRDDSGFSDSYGKNLRRRKITLCIVNY